MSTVLALINKLFSDTYSQTINTKYLYTDYWSISIRILQQTTDMIHNLSFSFSESEVVKKTYRIYLDKGEDGWLIVTSPDPEMNSLITQGKDEKEAIANAYDVTRLLLEEEGVKNEFNLVVIDRL